MEYKTIEIIDNILGKIQYTLKVRITNQGYEEIDHTADWALCVWAQNLAALFTQAALGMNSLAETILIQEPRVTRHIQITAGDPESLLVEFLNELVFIGEQDSLGFNLFEINIDKNNLSGELFGAKIVSQKKEIKAVTFHDLEIVHNNDRFEVQIVFDV